AVYARALEKCRKSVEFAGDRARIMRGESRDIASSVPLASLDFVFLDGDHSAPGTLSDLRNWCQRVKPEGFIAGHHWDHPTEGDVREGVEVFLSDFPDLSMEHDGGFWLIRREA